MNEITSTIVPSPSGRGLGRGESFDQVISCAFLSHPFDPSLEAVFPATAATPACKQTDSRRLFYALIHCSEHPETLALACNLLRQSLTETREHCAAHFSKHYHPEALQDLLAIPMSGPAAAQSSAANLQSCLLQASPVILTEPCWLQAISQAATSDNPFAVKLMAVYLNLTRGEHCKALYQGQLLSAGLEAPALHTWAFAKQTAISDCMFDFAALQLALAHNPRVFFPEIMGFTLAFCRSHSFIAPFFIDRPVEFFTIRQTLPSSQLPYIISVIEDYLQLFAAQADHLWSRIQSGFWLYQRHDDLCYQHLNRQLENPLSITQALANVLQHKAPNAVGHHGKIWLGDKPLDDWFKQVPFDSENFLSTLKASPYIDTDNSAASRLLKLIEFNGPMFGVFNEAEKTLLTTWIKEGNEETQAKPHSTIESTQQPEPANAKTIVKYSPAIDEKPGSDIAYSSLNNRELYYYLVNADLFPAVSATAAMRVKHVLRLAKLFNRLPFRKYSHQAFENYIDSLYQHEVNTYQPLQATPKLSRETYLWGIEQFAPTILTDGCWLQHSSQLSFYSNHAIGAILFKIYEDECGNGILEQNHPYIYRQLLNSVDIKLPPIHSRAFIEHPGFLNSAFDIPVYLLAISKFPSRFLPELLGLNMAIELSGLGKVYLRLSQELSFWGINPAIVDVHISIDNLASGHADLAKNAIQLYLDEIAACYGEQTMQNHWRRIHTGYCSLQQASTRFKYALAGRYLLNTVGNRFTSSK